jgi:FHS family L-fucose permease-like MFS transporter
MNNTRSAPVKTNEVGIAVKAGPDKLLWILFASYFTFGIVLNVVGVIIPVLIRQYHLSLFVGGLMAFALYVPFGVFSIPAGIVADRVGSKPVVVCGVFLMAASCAAILWVKSFVAIALIAFVIGAGIALLQTAGNPLIALLDRRENYHRNLTLTIGFCGIGAFAGPFCLSALQTHGQPWQRLYGGYAILCFTLLLLLLISRFPEREVAANEKLHLPEVVKLLGHPIAVVYFFAVFFYVGAEVGTAAWIVKFFQQVHGLGPERVSAAGDVFMHNLPALSVLTVSMFWGLQAVGRLTSGPGIHRLGARSMLQLYALGALGALLLATFGSVTLAVIGFAACGFFTSVLITLLFSGAIHTFTQSRGAISGLLVAASIGGAVIPPLVGLTADHFGLRIAMIVPALCFAYVVLVSFAGKAKYE